MILINLSPLEITRKRREIIEKEFGKIEEVTQPPSLIRKKLFSDNLSPSDFEFAITNTASWLFSLEPSPVLLDLPSPMLNSHLLTILSSLKFSPFKLIGDFLVHYLER